MRIPRNQILQHLQEVVASGRPIVGSGAGIGLSAKCEEMGGTDLIICYNTGYYRMQGRSSTYGILPVCDANEMLYKLAREILPVVKHTPVVAGVHAHDPFRDMRKFLTELSEMGFSGIQNFPSFGGCDGQHGNVLIGSGMGYDREVELIRLAHEMDFLTTPYVWSEQNAIDMAKAGADIVVVHTAMTVGGSTGIDPSLVMSLDQACIYLQKVRDAVTAVRPDVYVIAHGGPIAYPADLKYVLEHTHGLHGFYGASSCERLPVEEAIPARIREFKAVKDECFIRSRSPTILIRIPFSPAMPGAP